MTHPERCLIARIVLVVFTGVLLTACQPKKKEKSQSDSQAAESNPNNKKDHEPLVKSVSDAPNTADQSQGTPSDDTQQNSNQTGNSFPWQNPSNRYDVNNDSEVSQKDVDAVINELNLRGSRNLDNVGPVGASKIYFDVNGDGMISSADSLMVINFLNKR